MHLNTIRRIKQERMDLNESYQCLIRAGGVKSIRPEHQYHAKSIRTLLHASKEIDLTVKKTCSCKKYDA